MCVFFLLILEHRTCENLFSKSASVADTLNYKHILLASVKLLAVEEEEIKRKKKLFFKQIKNIYNDNIVDDNKWKIPRLFRII